MMSATRKVSRLALLTIMAAALFSLESLITLPIPWLRLGLANIITVLALRWWGVKEGLIVTLLRVFLGGLISGKLFNPLFVMSLSGNLAAVLTMGLCFALPLDFSLIGVSVCGALVKNVVQLYTVSLVYIKNISLVSMLPYFLLSGLAGGIIIGATAEMVDKKMNRFLPDLH